MSFPPYQAVHATCMHVLVVYILEHNLIIADLCLVRIQWCQARPECNRLELKQLLVTPMQRITKYSLLVNAIAKKTQVNSQKESLGELVSTNSSHKLIVLFSVLFVIKRSLSV